nr:ABC transporter transmembrane domain-containing protein [Aestuariicella albida]
MAGRKEVLLYCLAIHLLGLALPLALLQIYDRILPSQSFGTATLLISGVALAILLDALLRYGRVRYFASWSARYETKSLLDMFNRMLRTDVEELEKKGGERISEAVRSIAQVRDFASGQALLALYDLPFIAVYILLIAYVAGALALIPLALFVIALLLTLLIVKRALEEWREVETLGGERQSLLWSVAAGAPYFKSLGAEPQIGRRFSESNQRFLTANARSERYAAVVRENSALLGQLSTILIVCFGAHQVIEGQLTTGALAAATLLAGRSIGPAMGALTFLLRTGQVAEASDKVDSLLSLPDSNGLNYGEGLDTLPPQPQLQLEGECLEGGRQLVDHGTCVLVEGRDPVSVSNLLLDVAGLTPERHVRISIDGQSRSAYTAHAYREAVAYVPRMTTLLPGSILNNLTLYDPRYNALAHDFAERLGLQPFLDNLRNGILTEVGPALAESLDEGIYQRIAIIRALVRKPKLLLLDHAAAGLDMDGQKRLAQILGSLQGETTVLLASRKPLLQSVCQQTIVVQGGMHD